MTNNLNVKRLHFIYPRNSRTRMGQMREGLQLRIHPHVLALTNKLFGPPRRGGGGYRSPWVAICIEIGHALATGERIETVSERLAATAVDPDVTAVRLEQIAANVRTVK